MAQKAAFEGDEVDRLAADWERERPDLDVTPMQVLSRVTRLSRQLDAMRKTAFATHGLQAWDFDVLAALRRAGHPYALSPGALTTENLVTSGTMTHRIDRLADRGFVTREPDPNDRRGVVVRLTIAGQTAVDEAFAELMSREAELLDALDQPLRADLANALRTIARSL